MLDLTFSGMLFTAAEYARNKAKIASLRRSGSSGLPNEKGSIK